MSNAAISPLEAARAVQSGRAVLIDIRERQEHARAHIPGAVLVPLSNLEKQDLSSEKSRAPMAIFHCHSGMRTTMNLGRLRGLGFAQTRILDGGLLAWKSAGLPVQSSVEPEPYRRRARMGAYVFIATGILLAATVSHIAGGLAALAGSILLLGDRTGILDRAFRSGRTG